MPGKAPSSVGLHGATVWAEGGGRSGYDGFRIILLFSGIAVSSCELSTCARCKQ